ncbi:uncharacterized protein JCM6883_002326 [Sporobolomyces salmoneus]|uniref:uncharacterized protein n=1 Tax=Sporobolomyces salmoneus TaxID=183962 RepID=UPI00317AFD7E
MVWGVLLANLRTDHYPNTSLATLTLVAGLSNFFQNTSPFITGRLGEKYGFKRMIAIGSALSVLFLVLSAFSVRSLPALFVIQGACLGFVHGIALPLFMTIPSQWFSKRRGLATGITVSGTGFGGGFGSLIMRGILPRLGYQNSMLVYAAISAFTYIIAWFLLATRKPPVRKVPQTFDTKTGLPPGIWKDPAFFSLFACVFVGVYGFLTPPYYLIAYTTVQCPELDPNSLAPSVPLIVSNFMLGIGRVFSGLVADFFGPVNSLFFSFFAGGILQLAFWSQATTYGSIIAFGALYQLLGGWFFALLPYAAAQLFGTRGLATITGYIIASQAIPQFIGASLSGLVLDGTGSYQSVAYYSGAMMLAGSLFVLPARFMRQRKVFARI